MPRLFLKLFGTFWITTVVILAASIWISFYIVGDEMSREIPDPRETDEVIRTVLEESDIEGLRRWIEEGDAFPPGQTVYMVDANGQEILGREVPDWLQKRITRMWTIDRRRNFKEGRGRKRQRAAQRFAAIIEAG
ncbi:MAG: hypothetical protein AAF438_09920, partial [Pseudomonadota bacterium]